MAEIATINGISPSAISTINGVSVSAIDTINGCTPGEGVPEAGVFLTIDSDLIDADLTDVPVGVVLDSSIAMLAGLGSTDWRYLHATSGGYELFVEVDIWDMTVPLAVLWIRCPSLLSSSDTVVKLEITSELNDFFVVESPWVYDTFDGTDGDPPNTGFWTPAYTQHSTVDYGAELNSNALRMYLTGVAAAGSDTCKIDSKFRLSGDFDIQVEFKNLVHLNHVSAGFEIGIRFDNGYYALIKPQYNSGDQFFERFYTGSSSDATYSRTNDYGKLRISRTGSTITTYTIDGSGSTWTQRRSVSVSSAECLVGFTLFDYNSGSEISCEADNFTINSCDSITGFIGETGDPAAQVVWDSNFVGVWHMSQDPSGGTDSILDSTANNFDLTPSGSMTSDDLVNAGLGKGIQFDGLDDVIKRNSITFSPPLAFPMTLESHGISRSTSFSSTYSNPYVSLADASEATQLMTLALYNNAARTYKSNATFIVVDGPTSVGTSEEVALAARYISDASLMLYLNGSYENQNTTSSSFPSGIDSISTGGPADSTPAYYQGITCEYRISNIDRSAAWIKVTAQNLLGNLVTISEVQPTIKYATIDSTLIDSDLTNFPVGIQITATDGLVNGLGATDYEGFHFTIGGVECYAEIDVWEPDNGSAVIWVRCPTVTSSADTVVKIQNVGDDNTTYVGVTGSTAAQTVWDSNAVGIYHLSQDPSGGAGSILDSTANGNVGTPDGAMASNDLVDGGFGKAITFDGSNDQIGLASVNYPSGSSNRTMTIMVSCSGTAIPWGYGTNIDDQRVLMVITANYTGIDIWGANIYYTNSGLTDGEYHVITAVLDGTTLNDIDIYVDGVIQTTVYSSIDPASVFNTTLSLNYMGRNLSGTYYASNISELHVEDTNRSAAWIKATAQNLLGNLVTIS